MGRRSERRKKVRSRGGRRSPRPGSAEVLPQGLHVCQPEHQDLPEGAPGGEAHAHSEDLVDRYRCHRPLRNHRPLCFCLASSASPSTAKSRSRPCRPHVIHAPYQRRPNNGESLQAIIVYVFRGQRCGVWVGTGEARSVAWTRQKRGRDEHLPPQAYIAAVAPQSARSGRARLERQLVLEISWS